MISSARAGAALCTGRGGGSLLRPSPAVAAAFRFPFASFFRAASMQLFARNHFVHQSQAQRLLGRSKVSLSESLPPPLSAPIKRGKRVAPPHAGTKPSVVSGNPIRVAGSFEATR